GVLGAAGLTAPQLLAACGGDDDDTSAPSPTAAPSGSSAPAGGGGDTLFFENWPAYIDPTEDGLTGTGDRFMEATVSDMGDGEAFNDNVVYFDKIPPVVGRGDTIEPDLIAPTRWMVGRLISLGWLDTLPIDQVPNAVNLRDVLVNPAWDPTGEFSLP